MTKYVASDLSNKIKATKADIEAGVEGKYPDVSVMMEYANELPSGNVEKIGDIIDFRMDDTVQGFLKCDRSMVQRASYPELAAHLDGKVSMFASASGSLVSGVTPLSNSCWDVSFSPDGFYLATAHGDSPTLTVYNTSDWTHVSGTPFVDMANAVVFSPDSTLLAVGSQQAPYITILNVISWSSVSGTPSLTANVQSVAFSPDGSLLAVGGGDGLNVYDTSDWSVVHSDSGITPSAVEFSPNGVFLAYADSDVGVLRVHDWSSVDMPSGASGLASNDISFSPDGRMLAAVSNNLPGITVINTDNWTVRTDTPRLSSGVCVEFSPDSRYMVFGSLFVSADLYRVDGWKLIGQIYNYDYPNAVDFSDDGKYVAFGDNDVNFISISSMNTVDDAFIQLPDIPKKKHGNVEIKPMIRYEDPNQ